MKLESRYEKDFKSPNFVSFMERIPVRLVTDLDAPLLGAAALAGGHL